MTIEIARLVETIEPQETVLLFGAGSSTPSGVPTGSQLAAFLASTFGLEAEGYSLSEVASLVEERFSRRRLVDALRKKFKGIHPTRGLLNLPLYTWKSLYTTNYDNLIEQSYLHQGSDLTVYTSNFDFTIHENQQATKLFKLHGTIDKDIVDGNMSRLIITQTDYDNTGSYREVLFDRFKGDIAGAHLVIVGHSLQDDDIREIVDRAANLDSRSPGAFRISLLVYTRDDNRALLLEKRGFKVCFGGIDDFFSGLTHKMPARLAHQDSEDPLDLVPALRPVTVDVEHASGAMPDASAMFNGWPASYADILQGLTFERNVAEDLEQGLRETGVLCAVVLGASGVGKTTAARQAVQRMRQHDWLCWEHQRDYTLNVRAWIDLARALRDRARTGLLLVDEAHEHLQEVNDLVDRLVAEELWSLKLICVSTRNHWNPRIKTPVFLQARQRLQDGKARGEGDRGVAEPCGHQCLNWCPC